MRLLFVADGRSPIALNWIGHFADTGHEIHLVSTFPCQPEMKLASLHIVPVALSGAAAGTANQTRGGGWLRTLTTPRMRTTIQHWLGPLTLAGAGRRLREVIHALSPDLIHAMRIPYEGMIAALAKKQGKSPPLLISIWGNDFTLHAPSTPLMAQYTRMALQQTDALHTDCYRDLRLAIEWGFEKRKPSITVPGNGGIDLKIFYPLTRPPKLANPGRSKNSEVFTIINPRGFRAYVRNDTFFKSIPAVLEKHPNTQFICPAMAGDANASPHMRWLYANNLVHAVSFLPKIPRTQMADLFRQAVITVSPSEHDGTPNTLLEAMACGCFPIAGDIESVREWISPGENGLLFDPGDPQALAKAILEGLENAELRDQAEKENARLITERAEIGKCMEQVEGFYTKCFVKEVF